MTTLRGPQTSEARQQGLFQIFSSCCNLNKNGCEDCYYTVQQSGA